MLLFQLIVINKLIPCSLLITLKEKHKKLRNHLYEFYFLRPLEKELWEVKKIYERYLYNTLPCRRISYAMYCPRTRPLPVPSSIPSRRILNSRCHLSQAFLSNSCQVCLPLVDWYLNNVYYYNLIIWIEVLNLLWIRFKDKTFRVANDKCLAQLGDLFNHKKVFNCRGLCLLYFPLDVSSECRYILHE